MRKVLLSHCMLWTPPDLLLLGLLFAAISGNISNALEMKLIKLMMSFFGISVIAR